MRRQCYLPPPGWDKIPPFLKILDEGFPLLCDSKHFIKMDTLAVKANAQIEGQFVR